MGLQIIKGINFIFVIAVLATSLILALAEGDRHFNIFPSELKEKCNHKGNSLFFTRVGKYQKEIGNAKSQIDIEISNTKLEHQNTKLQELCYSNANLTARIKDLYYAALDCLNNTGEKLNQEDAERTIKKMVDMICTTIKFSVLNRNEGKCMNSLPKCVDSWSSIYYLVPLPLIRSTHECTKLNEYFECRFDHMFKASACTKTTRDRYNEITKKLRSLFVCEK